MDQYRSLKDYVYEYIAGLIDSGKVGDGDKITEQQICDALNVSRTPIREALIQLAGDGYLENVPRRGFHVKGVSEESAREIVEIIGPLDGRAALLAASRLTDDDIAHLRFLQVSMTLALDNDLLKKYDDLQHEFHSCYIDNCGNEKLAAYIRQLNRYFMKREYVNVEGQDRKTLLLQANDEHAHIIRLFEQRDGVGLQRYIRDVHWNTENAQFFVW